MLHCCFRVMRGLRSYGSLSNMATSSAKRWLVYYKKGQFINFSLLPPWSYWDSSNTSIGGLWFGNWIFTYIIYIRFVLMIRYFVVWQLIICSMTTYKYKSVTPAEIHCSMITYKYKSVTPAEILCSMIIYKYKSVTPAEIHCSMITYKYKSVTPAEVHCSMITYKYKSVTPAEVLCSMITYKYKSVTPAEILCSMITYKYKSVTPAEVLCSMITYKYKSVTPAEDNPFFNNQYHSKCDMKYIY